MQLRHVRRLTDGIFPQRGTDATGIERRAAARVLVADEQPLVRIIVTEQVVPADDPAFYALHRIDLEAMRLLCVKAKNHFRAAFAERCSEIIDCDVPGPACLDLSQLPFRNARVAVH